jgi:hypothetical protein
LISGETDIKPQIVKLTKSHAVEAFECGAEPLDAYLQRYALLNQSAGAAQTYVAVTGDRVVGYYSLSAASVEYADTPQRLRKGLAAIPIRSCCWKRSCRRRIIAIDIPRLRLRTSAMRCR